MNTQRQSGSVLLVSLLALIALTLFAVTAVNTGMVNLRVIDNMQIQQQAEFSARHAINDALSTITTFSNPQTTSVSVEGYTVQLSEPLCLATRPAAGYSAVWGLAPEETEWEFTASVDDAATGAQVNITQGVAIRMAAGSCP